MVLQNIAQKLIVNPMPTLETMCYEIKHEINCNWKSTEREGQGGGEGGQNQKLKINKFIHFSFLFSVQKGKRNS